LAAAFYAAAFSDGKAGFFAFREFLAENGLFAANDGESFAWFDSIAECASTMGCSGCRQRERRSRPILARL
jgi:hypothetical protein